ncbi:MAG: 5-methylcytosine-specific restriction endonuclease system specificity protein McrC [Sphaerochaetaceae bacterium]
MIKKKSILIQNIYYMLSYAFTNLKQEDFEDISKEDFHNIHNLFASILAKGIGQQLKRGLYRKYLNRNENLVSMRGKIEMSGTIQNKIMHKQILTCEFDELSENNQLNQILKTTVMILLHHANVDPMYKNDLRKKMLFFSNVDLIEPNTIKWSSIEFQRNYNSYRMLINICQLILEGMLLTTDKGTYKLASFVDEQHLHRLYEKFILEYYYKEYPSLKVNASQIPWALDDDKRTMLPIMQSDVTLSYGNKSLIIDAKFWSHNTQTRGEYNIHTIHSSNLYQIFTYVKNKNASYKDNSHEVAGILLYARTDELIQPDASYSMSNNKISVKTLDLNCDFQTIANQLNVLVEEYFGKNILYS